MTSAAIPITQPKSDLRRKVRCILIGGSLLLLIGLFTHSEFSSAPAPINSVSYTPPALEGYEFEREHDGDGNGDNVMETRIRHFLSPAGDRIFSMTTRGQLWAWSLDRQGDDDSDVGMNYVIRDSNCDGSFDERYRLEQEFHVPACLE